MGAVSLLDVHLGDLTGLVIASKDCNSILVAHLEADEQRDSLNGIVTSIHIISHEEVVGIRRLASNSEQFDEVVPLTVNVSAHGHRAANSLDVGLILKNLSCLIWKQQKKED
jgi:hypothetical protein